MASRSSWFVKVSILTAMLVVAGCGKKAAPPVDADVTTSEPTPTDSGAADDRDQTTEYVDPMAGYEGIFVAIPFEFDKYRITDEAKPLLERMAGAMKEKGTWKLLIEGHCDERGSNEYNLGLGEQRALAAKRYLVSLGIEESRFQTVSYGEERPLDSGQSEGSWSKNRRAEFRVEAPQS